MITAQVARGNDILLDSLAQEIKTCLQVAVGPEIAASSYLRCVKVTQTNVLR